MPSSDRIALCPADAAIAPRCMLHFFFHNPTGDAGFMEYETLCGSLHQALRASMPLALAEDMQMESLQYGGLTVKRATGSKRPQTTRHVDAKRTIANMIDREFVQAAQPEAIASAPRFTNPLAGDPLVTLDVVYMSDGVGLCLSFSHAVADMGACARFCREWSCLARSMYTLSSSATYRPKRLNTDRAWFWETLVSQATPVELDFDKHLDMLSATSQKSDKSRADDAQTVPLSPSSSAGGTVTLYRVGISAEAISKLGEVRNKVAPGASIPSFISALLWRAKTRACPTADYTYLGISLTARFDPRFAAYWGNAATLKHTQAEAAEICSMDIGDIAQMIQDIVREFTLPEFVHILDRFTTGTKYGDDLARFVDNGQAPLLVVSNISRLPVYSVDFGFGPPVKVIFPPFVCSTLVSFFPMSAAGGIEFFLHASDAEIQQLTSDSILGRHITLTACEL